MDKLREEFYDKFVGKEDWRTEREGYFDVDLMPADVWQWIEAKLEQEREDKWSIACDAFQEGCVAQNRKDRYFISTSGEDIVKEAREALRAKYLQPSKEETNLKDKQNEHFFIDSKDAGVSGCIPFTIPIVASYMAI